MDYQKEFKDLEEYKSTEWFKPGVGTHFIEVKGEGEVVDKDFKDEVITQWNLPITCKNKDYMWSVTKGKTLSSLYGQIISLAAKNKNLATGLKFTLIVKFDGKKNDYTIPEALTEEVKE